MRVEDLNLFDVIERDEPRWDDDKPEPVRYRVEDDWWGTCGVEAGLRLVRRGEFGTFINALPLDGIDLSDFRKVSR